MNSGRPKQVIVSGWHEVAGWEIRGVEGRSGIRGAKANELDETSWATPALDGNQVLVKTQSALYRFGRK